MGITETKIKQWGEVEVCLTRKELETIKKQKKDEGIIEGRTHSTSSPDTIKVFKSMGDKIDNLASEVNKILIKMEGLPQAIFEKADDRYACKKTEIDLSTLVTKIETRNYDWLKYLLTAIGSIAIGVLIAKLK